MAYASEDTLDITMADATSTLEELEELVSSMRGKRVPKGTVKMANQHIKALRVLFDAVPMKGCE